MERHNVRVVLAAECPEVRHFLRDAVEGDGGAVIVGQAENASKALDLARHLRPDAAIIDCHLPHAVGLDTVPLSRTGGLDTAQAISEEIPNTKVILLNNLDWGVLPDSHSGPDVTAVLATNGIGGDAPLVLQDLCQDVVTPNALVFASVEARPVAFARENVTSLSGVQMLCGGLGILGGLTLIAALAFAEAWPVLALAGAVAVGFGIGRLWRMVR